MSGAGLAEDAGRREATFFQLWATHEMPVSLTDDAMATQRDGSTTTILGTGAGSVLRIGILGPGARSPMHRTESLDYGICLEGECDMELDGGEVVTVRAGDVVIQRGTNHVWHNRSDAACRFAWILLDATPVDQWAAGSRCELAPRTRTEEIMRIIDLSHTIETLPDDMPAFMRVDVTYTDHAAGAIDRRPVRRTAAPAAQRGGTGGRAAFDRHPRRHPRRRPVALQLTRSRTLPRPRSTSCPSSASSARVSSSTPSQSPTAMP